uniref:Uncharacterized protein n=1 Tax=Rhizophora mucronata TaxID=61149 RepID=A0A2P2PMY6_RHIMU
MFLSFGNYSNIILPSTNTRFVGVLKFILGHPIFCATSIFWNLFLNMKLFPIRLEAHYN